MSSHLGEIEKGFKELTFGLRLKMDELCIPRIWGGFKEHSKWRTQPEQRLAGGKRMSHAVEIAKTYLNQSSGFQPVSHCLLEGCRSIASLCQFSCDLSKSHP